MNGKGGSCCVFCSYKPVNGFEEVQFYGIINASPWATGRCVMMTLVRSNNVEQSNKQKQAQVTN